MTEARRMFDPLDEEAIHPSCPVAEASVTKWRPLIPVPDGVQVMIPRCLHGAPSGRWDYRDADGRLLGAIARFDKRDGGKEILLAAYCSGPGDRREWRWTGFPEPRPLYGLDRLAARPDAPVLVVEGEKTANAAEQMFTDHVAVTSPGGANGAHKADWSPLVGRTVTIWPDHDEPGERYAGAAAHLALESGATAARIVELPTGWPEGWDLADAPPAGAGPEELRAMLHAARSVREAGGPDRSVLRQGRRAPPELPVEVFGPWASWISSAAEAAGCPPDYVAAPFLAAVAALVGNGRAVAPWNGWEEPAVLWLGCVGDPSSGKSPGADAVLRAVRSVELTIAGDFEAKHAAWRTQSEAAKASHEQWKGAVQEAVKAGREPPALPQQAMEPPEPARPRVLVNDATPEALSTVLAANPRGVMMHRDELAGWLGSFERYNAGGGRAFWIEAFGARSFTLDRVKHGKPVRIERLSASVLGNIQPERLADLLAAADDGLPARFLWTWPEPLPPRRPRQAAPHGFIERGFERLLDLKPVLMDEELRPIVLPLSETGAELFQRWREAHYRDAVGGLLASAYGKLPGALLRLSLLLELCWWAAGSQEEPAAVGEAAVLAAIALVEEYWKPMAQRVYGDASLPRSERNAATLARWLLQERPSRINVREMRREARLPGLRDAEALQAALAVLVDAGWISAAPERAGGGSGRRRGDYVVNAQIYEVES